MNQIRKMFAVPKLLDDAIPITDCYFYLTFATIFIAWNVIWNVLFVYRLYFFRSNLSHATSAIIYVNFEICNLKLLLWRLLTTFACKPRKSVFAIKTELVHAAMRNIVLHFLLNILLIFLIYVTSFYCFEGFSGSLPTLKIEFFVIY